MPMTPGLNPNIRMPQEEPQAGLGAAEDILVEIEEGKPDRQLDDKGNVIRI